MMRSNEEASPGSEILSPDDLNEIVRSLPELYGARDMTGFPLASLRLINRLIPAAQFSSYNEIEMKTGSARVFFEPAEFEEEGERHKPNLWKYRHQHPIMRLFEQGDHEGVKMISDFLEPEALHKLEIYQEVLAKMGVEDTLSITLPSTRDLKVFYAVNSPARFTERDRMVAKILQPHLVQAFENVLAFTDAKAMAALSAHAFQAGSHGLILADNSGRIIHASEIASDHLAILEPERGDGVTVTAINERLHPRLLDWLDEGPPSAEQRSRILEVEDNGSRVLFRSARVDGEHWVIATQMQTLRALAVSLQEVYGLSDRQADVLFWISRGKSNADIAAILEISDRTVAKHIELLFDKLGVENRLAATRKALDAIG
jgi:DNA-binding CsgD family transcriptional regulator